MLGGLRRRLTYANVMATVAVFIALGGSSYAALRVTSRNIANHTIKEIDVKRNSLGGKAVRESKLGQVPSAKRAGSSGSADTATNAANAGSAASLAGLGPSAFERSTRIQYGRGSSESTTPLLLFSWPQMGIDVMTDGDLTFDNQILLKNTNPPGGSDFYYSVDGLSGAYGAIQPGATTQTASGPETARAEVFVTEAGEPGRSLWIRCYFNYFASGDLQTRCFGIRSQAG
jgi:hypothetical protein